MYDDIIALAYMYDDIKLLLEARDLTHREGLRVVIPPLIVNTRLNVVALPDVLELIRMGRAALEVRHALIRRKRPLPCVCRQ